jgi:two-component system, chemotaxis family, chemotaxis protein CheY
MEKKILVVDDSRSIREVVSFTLQSQGYEVLVGVNGKDALKHLDKGENINLVITDLHMPEMDGISFIREIRKNDDYKHIPILFLSTETSQEKKQEAKEAGATGWMVKPFQTDKLIKILNKLIR